MNSFFPRFTPGMGSLVLASLGLLYASSASSAESNMSELQNLQGQRANTTQLASGMSKATQQGSKTVAGNMGGSGASTPPVGAQSANRRALNPQPLPPVDRPGAGVGVAKRDRSALPTGIIIVGGKPRADR